MSIDAVLERFEGVKRDGKGWKAKCPAHQDRDPSLSVSEGADGRVLIKCHAGCSTESICAAVGISMSALFPQRKKSQRRIVATYDYQDANGNLLFQVVRFEPKDFRQRQPDTNAADGWTWNTRGVAKVLFRLPEITKDIQCGRTIFGCEGEKDALEMVRHGLAATCNPGGAGKWRNDYTKTLRDADVVLVADKDEPGRKHAQNVATALHGITKRLRVIELPDVNGSAVKDAADFFAAGGDAGTVSELADAAPEWTPPGATSATPAVVTHPSNGANDVSTRLNSNKPKVELPCDGRLLSTFGTELAEILKDQGIYQRGGLAFIVNAQKDGLEVVTAQMLRTLVEQHLVCFRVKRTADGDVVSLDRTMKADDAEGILCAQQFLSRLPQVERVATARLPVMREDGSIQLLQTGYDRESLTLTLPQCDYDEAMPLTRAKAIIDELLCEFPFADAGRSKAVAVSAMVGLFGVGLLPRGSLRPVIIYLANAEGAGKTLLAKCAILPVYGLVKTDGDLKDKTETSKELLTAVIEARPYILFDNCKKHLDSPYLEAFATSVFWNGRVLGVSKSFCGPNNVMVFVTGNGCTVSPDMRRRALFGELFMEDERAEDRKFRRELDEGTLLAKRPDILSALWAFVREWDAAGRPKPSRTHSSFPRWADIIGGIVEFAGYACPLDTAEIQSASDIDGADMRELVKLLGGGEPVKFDELTATAREHGLFERLIGSEGDLKPAEKSAFGKLLKRYDRRVFCGLRFVVDGKGHSRTFRAVSDGDAVHGQHGQHGVSVSPEKCSSPRRPKDHADHATVREQADGGEDAILL